MWLFADTEILKDVPQHFIVGYFAGDFTEIVQAFSDILGQEVTANTVIQTINNANNCFMGLCQRFIMTYV